MELRDVAPELLILILEELDPESLRLFCQASRRVYFVVMKHQALRYQFELGISGMKDGPATHVPSRVRLQQLLNLKKVLPTLCWSRQDCFHVTLPATVVGVSGGFFYHTSLDAPQYVLELCELPCSRLPRTCLARLRHIVPFAVRSVTVDAAQNLLVIGGFFQLNDFFRIRLHFRKLLVDAPNKPAVLGELDFTLEWGDDPEHYVSIDQVQICGRMVGMSFSQKIGQERTGKFVLVDWRTGNGTRWKTEVLSFQFLDENEVLVVIPPEEEDDDDDECEDQIRMPYLSSRQSASPHVRPRRLAVHSLCNLKDSEDAQIRVYQLPKAWNDAALIEIMPNMSTVTQPSIPSGTMFHSDPARHIFVLVVVFSSDGSPSKFCPRKLVVLSESFLRAVAQDRSSSDVPWSRWRPHCFVKDISQIAHSSLHVIGTRILYLESLVSRNSVQGSRRVVHVLDFNPHVLECIRPKMGCPTPLRWRGMWDTVTTVENHGVLPHIRTQTIDPDSITEFFATEDNLILVYYRDAGVKVTVLTFDKLPACFSAD